MRETIGGRRCRRAWRRRTARFSRRRQSMARISRWCWCSTGDGRDELPDISCGAPRARLVVEERQLVRVRVEDPQRPQEPLRRAMQREHGRARLGGADAAERVARPLLRVDAPRLLARFIDAQHEASVQELFVDVHRRGREEDHQPGPRRGIPASPSARVRDLCPCSQSTARPDCRSFNA